MLTQFKSRTLTTNHPRITILVIGLATLMLAGCMSAQTNLALYGQEQWSGVQAITLSSDFVELMESEGADLSSELSPESEGLDQWLQQAQSATDRENVNVSFNEVKGDDGSLSYVFQADGSQYALLNELLFQGQAEISVAEVNGQRHVTIRYDAAAATEGSAGGASQADAEMSAEMMQLFGITIVTRISGGEIISHNADRVEGNTAIWDTPRLIQITLTEAAQFDPGTITPAEAPAGAGPSLATLLTAVEESADSSSSPSSAGENSASSPETTTGEPDTAPGDTTQDAASTSDSVTQAPAPVTDTSAQDPDLMTDIGTGSAGSEDGAVTPPGNAQQLPTSGAILPEPGPAVSFILAGLVLIGLVGSGVATTLRTGR